MTKKGYDHFIKIIPEAQIACHRIDFPVRFSDYNSTRHALYTAKYYDSTYTKPFSLEEVLMACSQNKIIPVINLNGVWWYKHNFTNTINRSEFSEIAKCLDDILKERFSKYYISIFNEPGKWLNTPETISYTNFVCDKIGTSHVIVGNDEFNMLDWDEIGRTCKAEIIGVHPLSSLGTWSNPKKYFHIIKDWATIGATYGKQIMATEAGSWFRKYRTGEGHQINKDVILECEKYNYLACLIVFPDVNKNVNLGYRVWDKNYNNIIEQKNYDDFINFIKQEKVEDDMKLEQFYYKGKVNFPNDKDKYGVKFLQLCFGLSPDGIMGDLFDTAVKNYQTQQGITVDGIVGPQTFNEIYKSVDNAKYYMLCHSYWARGITQFYEV